ncbi:hypothetical protein XENTR_v10003421 [Xenopus tropicalis]|nr:baculoviral IAP repeat-containing protein 7 isoform X1 [Xenopus tropicalis]XP_031749823.1 baculoviral IAP repeat-containing protein 7 isoform X1 [Xenopus tropicalis]KAE8574423.1 hypothetical protein XENTR_v10003421 [Xenopus tropicalis]
MDGDRGPTLSGRGVPRVPPNMRSEAERQRSFRAWPHTCRTVSPAELARSGFYYLGPGDRVQCFSCGGVLRSWEPGDRPDTEHRKFFPSCPFLQVRRGPPEGTDSVDGQILGQLSGEEPDRTWEPVCPQMAGEGDRLGSFSTWPRYANGDPQQLAGAGFFYTGHRDHVKCFHCDGGLRNWEQGDDPWTEHAKWFPMCDFLLQVKGEAFIRSVQESFFSSPETSPESVGSYEGSPVSSAGSPPVCPFLSTSVAQGALQMGFKRNRVSSLMINRFILTGSCYGSVSELVTDLIRAEEIHGTESVSVPRAPTQRERPEPPKEPAPPLSTEEQLRQLKEERMCKVCMDNDVSMVFVPCGHLVVCTECAPNLRHCPICRAAIRGSVRAFMS